ncbi:MAG: hypothetical protein V3T61_11755, partial [Acidobacteriota bacterium]
MKTVLSVKSLFFLLALLMTSPLLEGEGGNVHVQKMNPDGTIGEMIDEKHWSGGWTTGIAYEVGGKTYLFLQKEGDGTVHVQKINEDGTIGEMIDEKHWSGGWTT